MILILWFVWSGWRSSERLKDLSRTLLGAEILFWSFQSQWIPRSISTTQIKIKLASNISFLYGEEKCSETICIFQHFIPFLTTRDWWWFLINFSILQNIYNFLPLKNKRNMQTVPSNYNCYIITILISIPFNIQYKHIC